MMSVFMVCYWMIMRSWSVSITQVHEIACYVFQTCFEMAGAGICFIWLAEHSGWRKILTFRHYSLQNICAHLCDSLERAKPTSVHISTSRISERPEVTIWVALLANRDWLHRCYWLLWFKWAHMFEYFAPSWWNCLRRIRGYGLAEGFDV